MASKPLTTEAIALTEKKMDMTLEDIIKLSKHKPSTTTTKKQRVSTRNQTFLNTGVQAKSSKVQRFMDSRSSLRQGVLAQRRSNFQANQFPLAAEAARKAAVAPLRNRAFVQGRGLNVNKPRARALPVQRKATTGSFTAKPQPHANGVSKQRPQTLDSRFANMKEQRMRALSQQNNGGRRNGGGQQRQQWGRGRFGNQ